MDGLKQGTGLIQQTGPNLHRMIPARLLRVGDTLDSHFYVAVPTGLDDKAVQSEVSGVIAEEKKRRPIGATTPSDIFEALIAKNYRPMTGPDQIAKGAYIRPPHEILDRGRACPGTTEVLSIIG